jgi:hypothetical protein
MQVAGPEQQLDPGHGRHRLAGHHQGDLLAGPGELAQ